MKLKHYTTPPPDAARRLLCTKSGVAALAVALSYFTEAKCPLTLRRIRLAISSAKGAVRNADCRAFREERAQ